MTRTDITNIITVLIMAFGYSNDNQMIYMIGLFALSGAITNTLAIHMLFEKVPFLYGSGVIESRFSEFKASIHALIMNQFFTKENLSKFFQEEVNSAKKMKPQTKGHQLLRRCFTNSQPATTSKGRVNARR